MIHKYFVVLESLILHIKIVEIRPPVLEKKIFEVFFFFIYGHGGHLGHVT